MASRPLTRIASMDAGELRFRLAAESRKLAGRVAVSLNPPRWKRSELRPALRGNGDVASRIREAPRALADDDWQTAHRAIASHVASRRSAFPIDTSLLGGLATDIRQRFPRAARNAAARADRILDGRYDLLGYTDVAAGTPPSWHHDPVHGRHAPIAYWPSIQYLDPAFGDHKIIWELNRHQHWIALGRAFHLTGDRRYYVEFVAQLESWLAANPPLVGINWCSMLELAFRCLSWTWALHLFAGAVEDDPAEAAPWTVDLLMALDRQLAHAERNLSRYFSPNTHLTGEALALYVCGLALPELDASEHRARTGRDVLLDESERQIRADGGHAELSPHYHRYSTDFYLLALSTAREAGDPAADAFERAARSQAEYLRTIADDRGHLPLIGDDDGGQLFPICGPRPFECADTLATAAVLLDDPALAVGKPPEAAHWLCAKSSKLPDFVPSRGRWKSRALPETGYFVSRTRRGDHLMFDAGPHGYLNGGHAHADALSLTITVARRALVVDPGTATYTMDPSLRDWFRSSAMHNTVVIGRRSQSLPQGPFRWRTTVDARAAMWHAAPTVEYAEGSHAGYAPTIHTRGVLAIHGIGWMIVDHLLGRDVPDADAFWHLHPDWRRSTSAPAAIMVTHVDGDRTAFASSLPLELITSGRLALFAPVYGRVVSAACIRGRFPRTSPCSAATLIAATASFTDLPAVESIDVAAAPGKAWHGAAFRLRIGGRTGTLLAAVERAGLAGEADAAPGRMWGLADVKTDARIALLLPWEDGTTEVVLVNGTTVEVAGRAIVSGAGRGVKRVMLATDVHGLTQTGAEGRVTEPYGAVS